MSSGDPMDIAIATLADFIRAGIPGLTVKQEWPYANEKLVYPSLTISTVNPKRTPCSPAQQLSCSAPDENKRVIITEAVADWDDTFQLDLWTRDKNERKIITDQIIALFNSQEFDGAPDGLSLPMSGNFSEFCRYTIDTSKCVDDAGSAQRQERRELIRVLVNCREVRQRTYYAMVTIQTQSDAAGSDQSTVS